METTAGRRRWAVLAVGMLAMVAACAFQYGMPFLVPAFRRSGLSLAEAGLLISAPVAGVLCSLVLWGAVTDRVGERKVLVAGFGSTIALLAAASTVDGPVLLGVLLACAGATSACVHVASGRLILGWFAAHERGLAMGLRQTAQPLGVALAAVTLPGLGAGDPGTAIVFLAAASGVALVLIVAVVRDPAMPAAGDVAANASPYRGAFLWRVHASSSLLVVPQFTVSAFAFDYLVTDRAWPAATAGSVLAGAQLGGGAMRLVAGWWSDRTRSRLRPMRTLALVNAAILGGLAAGALTGAPVTVVLLVLAAALTASTNGLSFTAVAERAGRFWAGRALGVQNTTQNVAAAATPPAVAALVTAVGPASGYAAAFALAVGFPLIASVTIPVGGERPVS